jgi:FKBP-type peptidyl-prolyl cis-trans isomerase (trigger factor)
MDNIADLILDEAIDFEGISIDEAEVDSETEAMYLHYCQQLKYQAMSTGDYSCLMGLNTEEQKDRIRREAARNLKVEKALDMIIKKESLHISDKELEDEAMAISERLRMPYKEVKDFLGEQPGFLRKDLLINKALGLLSSRAAMAQSSLQHQTNTVPAIVETNLNERKNNNG